MPIRFSCQNKRCESWVEVSEDRARTSTVCPDCKMVQHVPAHLLPDAPADRSPPTSAGIQPPEGEKAAQGHTPFSTGLPARQQSLMRWDSTWLECPNCGRTVTGEDDRCPGCLRSLGREEIERDFAKEKKSQSALFNRSLLTYAGLGLLFMTNCCLLAAPRGGTQNSSAMAAVLLMQFAGLIFFLVGFWNLIAYRGLNPPHFLWGLFCGIFGVLIVFLIAPNVRDERRLRYEKFLRDTPR